MSHVCGRRADIFSSGNQPRDHGAYARIQQGPVHYYEHISELFKGDLKLLSFFFLFFTIYHKVKSLLLGYCAI